MKRWISLTDCDTILEIEKLYLMYESTVEIIIIKKMTTNNHLIKIILCLELNILISKTSVGKIALPDTKEKPSCFLSLIIIKNSLCSRKFHRNTKHRRTLEIRIIKATRTAS